MRALKETLEVYREGWLEFNWFGRCVLFPVFLAASPVVFVFILGSRERT